MATITLRRLVAARAMVTQMVVASVPFLANTAQSAWSTVATSSSLSSTMSGDGPFWQSASVSWRRTASSTSGWWWPSTMGP